MGNAEDWIRLLPNLMKDECFSIVFTDLLEQGYQTKRLDVVDCIQSAFEECMQEVLTLSWDGTTPLSPSGSSRVCEVSGVYVCSSTDWEPTGPSTSLLDVLSDSETFQTRTNSASLDSSELSTEQMLKIARSVCPEEGTIRVNGDKYGWSGRKLALIEEQKKST